MRKATESKQKTTLDFIRTEEERATLSVKVKLSIYNAVDLERQQLGYTWVQLQEAMFRRFLDEIGVIVLDDVKITKAKS